MQFSVVKEIFGQPWQIEASTFQRYFPLVISALHGVQFTPEPEPQENVNYHYPLSAHKSHSSTIQNDGTDDDPDQPAPQLVIHVLPIRGVMMKHDLLCGPRGTRTLGDRLRDADTEEMVIGHIIIFETGGGSSDSVPEIAEAISECKKPVVAWVDGMMCSAGQFAGSYCNEIIASRATDWVGSIGTMMVWEGRKSNSPANFEGTIHQRIYADDASQKNEEFEAAINNSDFKLVKERILNPHNLKFISEIKKNRPGVEDIHLHGRVFDAGEVVGSLVDSIGDFQFAINRVLYLANYSPEVSAPNPPEDPDIPESPEIPDSPDNPDNSANNKKIHNSKIMHTKFKHLQKVLGPDPLEFESDNRRTFTDDEMQTVEDALAANSQEEFQAALDAERQTVSSLKDQNTQLKSGVAETTLQLEAANKLVSELQSENATLRKAPAAPPSIAPTVTEPPLREDHVEKAIADKYENPMDALQEISEVYLHRKL